MARTLTGKEVAEQLGVSLSVLKVWRSKGAPASMSGRRLRYDLAELRGWLAEHVRGWSRDRAEGSALPRPGAAPAPASSDGGLTTRIAGADTLSALKGVLQEIAARVESGAMDPAAANTLRGLVTEQRQILKAQAGMSKGGYVASTILLQPEEWIDMLARREATAAKPVEPGEYVAPPKSPSVTGAVPVAADAAG